MITLYTSIGHYRLVSGKNNVSYPVITANGKEHRLDTKRAAPVVQPDVEPTHV